MEPRLTEQDIQEIRERARSAGNGAMAPRLAIAHYLNDVDRLAAEIDRLEARLAEANRASQRREDYLDGILT